MPFDYTPYKNIRVPVTGNVVDAADWQTTATDINTVLTASKTLHDVAVRRSSVSAFNSGQSIVKNTQTVISYAVGVGGGIGWDTGLLGPGAAAYWSNANPTRLTAPATGLYLATLYLGVPFGTLSTTNILQPTIGKNGSFAAPNLVTDKQAGTAVRAPDKVTTCVLYAMTAGDYLEGRVYWNGTPAGPLALSATFQLAQVALP